MDPKLERLGNQYKKAYWENLETKKNLKAAISKLQKYLEELKNKPMIFTGHSEETAEYNSESTIEVSWHEHYEDFVNERVWIRKVELSSKHVEENGVLVDTYSLHVWLSKVPARQGTISLYKTRWENIRQILPLGPRKARAANAVSDLEFI